MLSLLLLVDGSLMPSWFDIHEIPVTAVSYASIFFFFFFSFFLIGKLHIYAVGPEPTTIPSILLLKVKEVLFELEFIGFFIYTYLLLNLSLNSAAGCCMMMMMVYIYIYISN